MVLFVFQNFENEIWEVFWNFDLLHCWELNTRKPRRVWHSRQSLTELLELIFIKIWMIMPFNVGGS